MSYKLMLTAVGAIMMTGCGAEEMEIQEGMVSDPASKVQGLGKELRHCVAQAVTVEHGKKLSADIIPIPAQCFDTFAEAISHATKGTVQLSPQATVDDFKPEQVQAQTAVIAVEYDYPNLLGGTLTLASDISCAQGDIYFPSLPTTWDNRISSALLYDTSCRSFLHFTEPNFLGMYGNCGFACNLVGSLDNQTSSIYLRYW